MIFRSPYPPITIPHASLTEFVLERAAERGDKPALIDGPTGRTLTYADLSQLVPRAAAGLAARGCARGDVCAIYSPNLPEYGVAFHAAALCGAATTTVNPLYTPAELAGQLNDAGARFIFTVPQLLPAVESIMADTALEQVFLFGSASAPGTTSFNDLLACTDEPPRVAIDPARDLVALPYSSGTSGLPKGVMLTHGNMVASLCQLHTVGAIKESDRLICVVPCAHLYGLQVIMNWSLHEGATVVLMPRFDLTQFLQLMQDYKITRAPLVPPLVRVLARHPAVAEFDLSHLKHIHSGGAPLNAEDARACAARLRCEIGYAYGQTEVSPLSHMSYGANFNHEPGAVGHLLPNTESRIVDWTTETELGPHEHGEVRTRGPQVMSGYLNQAAATAATFDADGWLRTGDVGYADESGHFYIVDRVKELIKYHGLQVAPAELEALLLTHPAVADAAVIPSPDAEAGEVPKAFIVLQGAATADELMAFVAARVAPQKKVRRVEFIEQIPRLPSGKILRRLLVERERTQAPT
ncbi:MAG TPA: AMP-binding protein [Pyrinomonadaceae bacterium]|nr:AMP-binding protein [Pyrinomonadaceae bacterium]